MKHLLLLLLWPLVLSAGIVLPENARLLPVEHHGPFVRLGDGAILGVGGQGIQLSRDEGRSWEKRDLFNPTEFKPRGERALLRTREGVVVYAFLNDAERAFKWDQSRGGPQEGCRLPVYVVRSEDDGRTWSAPALIQEGWCGAVRNMIQLRNGRLILVSQDAVRDPGRHVTIIHCSDDQGRTWRAGKGIDLGAYGGYGDHGGGIEGTVVEKKDGTLLLLLRTPQGCFQELNSRDGETWTGSRASTVEASDAPAMMMRLASGRLVLVWNRYADPAAKTGRRNELSIAFSTNDGLTWSVPQVIATNYPTEGGADARRSVLSYPYVFEPAPGQLWITTMQGGLRMALTEADWVRRAEKPLDGERVRLITLGDSITRGVRSGVKPGQTFSAQLQAGLRRSGLPVQVHSVGISGERSDQALRRLESEVIAQRPDFVTIMYGTNDSWIDPGKTECRIGVEKYEANLREIIHRLRAAHCQPILMTEPMFGEERKKNGLGEEPNVRLAGHMEAVRKVARELDVPLVDHFADWDSAQRQGQRLQAWTTDGTHPNATGHARMAGVIGEVVRPLVGEQLRRMGSPGTK